MKITFKKANIIYDWKFMERQFNTELGLAIRTCRRSRNLSQEYMAKKLNMTQTAYSKIEAGKSGLCAFRLSQILNLLGMDPYIIIAPF